MSKVIEQIRESRILSEDWQEHQRQRKAQRAKKYPHQVQAEKALELKQNVKPAMDEKGQWTGRGEAGWVQRSFSNRQMRRAARARERVAA